MNIQQQITELTKKLNYHDYRYYVLDDPELPDSAYDQLFLQLENFIFCPYFVQFQS